MTFDAIRLFVLVAKRLSITQAAREVHLSQPAASRQLKQLQQDLGLRLLIRTKGGIAVTKAGRLFFREVAPIFSQLEALHKKYTRGQDSLTIACNHDVSIYAIPLVMAEFSRMHPSVQLTLQVGNSMEIEELLLTSKVDLAVITNFTMLSQALFQMDPFRSEPLIPFVSRNHPLIRAKAVAFSDLGEMNLIIRSRRDGQGRTETELNQLLSNGIKLKIGMRCESAAAVKEAVRHGAGVGLLYSDVIKREIERGEFKVLNLAGFDVISDRYIVYSKERPLSALAQEFLVCLRASATRSAVVEKPNRQVSFGGSNNQARATPIAQKSLVPRRQPLA